MGSYTDLFTGSSKSKVRGLDTSKSNCCRKLIAFRFNERLPAKPYIEHTPYPGLSEAVTVSADVNNTKNDSPHLIRHSRLAVGVQALGSRGANASDELA